MKITHIGAAKLRRKIVKRYTRKGYSHARAERIAGGVIHNSARNASARKKNPRLNRVRGVKK